MLNKHTTSRRFELFSQQGREPTIAPGTGQTQVQFLLSALPTQKDSKFWYYVEAIWLKLTLKLVIDADSTFAGLNPAFLWQALASVQVQTPILGVLFQTNNTRGSVLGNIIQYFGFGFNDLPTPNLVGPGGGGTFYVDLYYRLPFAHDFLVNRMDTAPWAGFLEGGTVTLNIAPSTVFTDSGFADIIDMQEVKASVSLAMQPDSEARIHTPIHWREHITPGSSTKHVIPDMGSPDGLQGVDQSKGVGIAALMGLVGPTGTGLLPGTTADNITSYSYPFRDQPQILNPELPYIDFFESTGIQNRITGAVGAVTDMRFPYITGSAVPTGQTSGTGFNSPDALIWPVVSPGNDLFTSKAQTLAGAKEMNFQYSSTPSPSQRWVGCYLPVFDDQFRQSLVARIAPGSKGELTDKSVNKQVGGVIGAGKLAYVPVKVQG